MELDVKVTINGTKDVQLKIILDKEEFKHLEDEDRDEYISNAVKEVFCENLRIEWRETQLSLKVAG
ncbi:hypothetical protein [Ferdinandcohnia sp. SAFN-114]|uniref:hypothetical protein n=1 Tax=Ferdinandcohnia sp. SAFN-114 TaxID=3387275 RepID=UPI003F7F1DAD